MGLECFTELIFHLKFKLYISHKLIYGLEVISIYAFVVPLLVDHEKFLLFPFVHFQVHFTLICCLYQTINKVLYENVQPYYYDSSNSKYDIAKSFDFMFYPIRPYFD